MKRVLVFTATFNESDNISELIREVQECLPGAHMLIVDDNSPDGTGRIVAEIARSNPTVFLESRPRKSGLGSAHVLALKRAIAGNYDYLITMDADFSHHPKYLPQLVALLDAGNEFVIGSRYTAGGRCDYGFMRQLLSRSANTMAVLLLGIPLKESTTSYRGFNIELLKRLDLDAIRSTGYAFFVECVYRVTCATKKLAEFPIHFEDRRAGSSKISKIEIFRGVVALLRLAWERVTSLFRTQSKVPKATLPTNPCALCGSLDNTIIFRSTSVTGQDGAAYQCTNTEHASHGQIARCLGCGLIQTNPQLAPEFIEGLYADVRDEIYLKNIPARKRTFRYNLDRIRSHLPTRGKLLDVGAYCGVFLEVAKEDTALDVFGVEPSRWATEYCQTQRALKVSQGTLRTLPKEFYELDVITSWDVLEHVTDPMEELREVNRRLRIGGVYAFSTLNVENWFPKLAGERWPWYMDMHLYYFTNGILKFMLERAGFEVLAVQPYCHIITGDYLLRKLSSLGVPFVSRLEGKVAWLTKLFVPFRFGDIQLFVARKVLPVDERP
jgi:dolichol-phosphate mannosyltransferase